MAFRYRQPSSLAGLAGLSLLLVACGGSGSEELTRLEAENQALKARLSGEAPPSEDSPAAKPPAAKPLDDWSWANDSAAPRDPEPERSREVTPAPDPPPPPPPKAPEPKPKPAPKPAAPAPRPAPEPTNRFETPPPAPAAPRMEARRAGAGASLEIATVGELNSQTAQVGDRVEARLDRDLLDAGGRVVLPAGTLLTGRVTEVQAARKVKRKSRLAFQLDQATLADGRTVALSAGRSLEGDGWKKKDGAVIGGAAAGGAVLGQVLGGDSEATAAGAVIGGAIASGVLMSKRGEATVVPDGSILELSLDGELVVQQPAS